MTSALCSSPSRVFPLRNAVNATGQQEPRVGELLVQKKRAKNLDVMEVLRSHSFTTNVIQLPFSFFPLRTKACFTF